jgi:signal transduction histidine kinase
VQKKIITVIILAMVIISASLWIIGYLSVEESIDHSLQHKIDLAKIIANNIDLLLNSNLNRLYDVSLSANVDIGDGNWTDETAALKHAFEYSIFTGGLFILDSAGSIVLTYPPQPEHYINMLAVPYVSKVIREGKPVISDIYTVEPGKRKIIYLLVPLKSHQGMIVGAVGGEIDPSSLKFNEILKAMPAESDTYLEIIDSHGYVIASNHPSRMLKAEALSHLQFMEGLIAGKKASILKCHRCHPNAGGNPGVADSHAANIMAYAPLSAAKWGVSIIQPEREVFAPAAKMKKYFFVFSVSSIVIALVIAVGMSRSIVKPVHELIGSTMRIAQGNMSRPVAFGGTDEIGRLSSSFEVMRLKLADSLDELHRSNAELERKVIDRTKQINDNREKIKELLKKVMTSQEEERKRIAREFHDTIMQDLSAALIKIDVCRMYPESISEEKMAYIRGIIEKTIDEVHSIIKNLRPTILDDLGFDAAVRWLLDKHLESKGIHCHVNIYSAINDIEFEPLVEIELFRVIQEAIVNIARHSMAENVFVMLALKENTLIIDIEDDGCGFDTQHVRDTAHDTARGLGLLGMEERTAFFNGSLSVCSSPGEGTRVSLKVPVGRRAALHV